MPTTVLTPGKAGAETKHWGGDGEASEMRQRQTRPDGEREQGRDDQVAKSDWGQPVDKPVFEVDVGRHTRIHEATVGTPERPGYVGC
jgi:hypothetical protein